MAALRPEAELPTQQSPIAASGQKPKLIFAQNHLKIKSLVNDYCSDYTSGHMSIHQKLIPNSHAR
jgi:hypothetical protein